MSKAAKKISSSQAKTAFATANKATSVLDRPLRVDESALVVSESPEDLKPNTTRGLNALNSFLRRSDRKQPLFNGERIVLQLQFKVDSGKASGVKARLVQVPHPVHQVDSFLLIVAEMDESAVKIGKAHPEGKLLSFADLRRDYNTYEARAKLAGSYSAVLYDERTAEVIIQEVGSRFFKTAAEHRPISVPVVNTRKFEERLRQIATSVAYKDGGKTVTICVGTSEMPIAHVLENALIVIPAAVKDWNNVHSIHVKSITSVAIPIFLGFGVSVAPNSEKQESKDNTQVTETESKPKAKTPKKANEVPQTPKSPQTPKKQADKAKAAESLETEDSMEVDGGSKPQKTKSPKAAKSQDKAPTSKQSSKKDKTEASPKPKTPKTPKTKESVQEPIKEEEVKPTPKGKRKVQEQPQKEATKSPKSPKASGTPKKAKK